MTIHLGCTLPHTSCNQPGQRSGEHEPACLCKARLPPLFGLAPGGVCRAASVTGRAVRSYRTLSPLPLPVSGHEAVCFLWHFPWSRLRRTLSGTVSPWSPDFPHNAPRSRKDPWHCAIIQPTGVICIVSIIAAQIHPLPASPHEAAQAEWAPSTSPSVATVETSARPSHSSGRKCSWKARTTVAVPASYNPVTSTPYP